MNSRLALGTLVTVAVIAITPLLLFRNDPTIEFTGADGQAGDEVARIDPDHEPWFEPIWSPPGGETESALFALQAALGAGVLGYVAGSIRTRHRLTTAAETAVDLRDRDTRSDSADDVAIDGDVADLPVA